MKTNFKSKILISCLFATVTIPFVITSCVNQEENATRTKKKETKRSSKINFFVKNKKEIDEIKQKRNDLINDEEKINVLLKINNDLLRFLPFSKKIQKVADKYNDNGQEGFLKTSIIVPKSREEIVLEKSNNWLKLVKEKPNLLNEKEFILQSSSDVILQKEEVQELILKSAKKFYNDKSFKKDFLIHSFQGRKKAPFIDFDLFDENPDPVLKYAIAHEPLYYINAPMKIKQNKEYYYSYLRNWIKDFDSIPDSFKNDKKIIEIAINKKLKVPKTIINDFINDKDIVIKAIKNNLLEYSELNLNLKNDQTIALESLKYQSSNWNYLPDLLKQEDEFIYTYLLKNKNSFNDVKKSFFENEELVISLLKNNFNNIYNLDSKYQKKYFSAVEEYIKKLDYDLLDDQTKSDKNIVLSFIKEGNFLNKYSKLRDDLKYDYEIIKNIIKFDFNEFKNIPLSILDDKNFILYLINHNPNILAFLSDDFRGDKDIMIKAIKKEPLTFQYASSYLKFKEEVYKLALNKNLKTLKEV